MIKFFFFSFYFWPAGCDLQSGLEAAFISLLEESGLSPGGGIRDECSGEAGPDLLGGEREVVVNHGVEEGSGSLSEQRT